VVSFNELLGRARAGESEAFEQLVRPHLPLLLTLALGVVTVRADAEDAVQETLLRFHRHLPNLKNAHEARLYLARIATNEAKRLRRRTFLRRSRERSATLSRPAGPTPEQRLQGRELYRAAEEVALSLPVRQRQVFLLRAFEEMDVRETADLLELSPITVRRLFGLAKQRVERELLRLFGLSIEF